MDKRGKYEEILPQVASLLEDESDLIANMANVSALLHETFSFWWTGFYRVVDGDLLLGPFQGPVACTRIRRGRGVCGTALERESTIIVPDVELFPGHIACSAASRSEIVVPVRKEEKIVAVLDIDSQYLDTFDTTDQLYLEQIVALM